MLRCPYTVVSTVNSCVINDIVAISCGTLYFRYDYYWYSIDPTLITTNPYNGQVRLIESQVHSSGLLEIYLHNQWGTVCAINFNDAAADSACRQLGYTSAINYSDTFGYVCIGTLLICGSSLVHYHLLFGLTEYTVLHQKAVLVQVVLMSILL